MPQSANLSPCSTHEVLATRHIATKTATEPKTPHFGKPKPASLRVMHHILGTSLRYCGVLLWNAIICLVFLFRVRKIPSKTKNSDEHYLVTRSLNTGWKVDSPSFMRRVSWSVTKEILWYLFSPSHNRLQSG